MKQEYPQKMEHWIKALKTAHNGNADMDGFLAGDYGAEMRKLAQLRFRFEEDPAGADCLAFYRRLGVQKELFDAGNYYGRWAVFTPLEMRRAENAGKRYPLILFNHAGNSAIETDEFSNRLTQMAGKERFIVAMLQNTNWQSVETALDRLEEMYPDQLDCERVYLTGYSQGGQTTASALMRIPQRLTAVAPCGRSAFDTVDNHDVPFTIDELEKLTAVFVPVMQIVGECEQSFYAPVNDWHPRKDWGGRSDISLYRDPRHDMLKDPTMNHAVQSSVVKPPEGADKHEWMLGRLNMRLSALKCAPRDLKQCLSYLYTPEDVLHRKLGFYGDLETTRTFYNYRHWQCDIWNRDGIHAFRYIVVENSPHWFPVMSGELVWEFFRQFRRDRQTKKIIQAI